MKIMGYHRSMARLGRCALLLALLMVVVPVQAGEDRDILDFPFETLSGPALKMSDLRGKVVLVNFWATWCSSCKKEIPEFVQFQDAYRDKGVVVVGVNVMERDTSKSHLEQFAAAYKINYPLIYGQKPQTSRLAKALGGLYGLPTSMVVNKEGKVVSKITGILLGKRLEQAIVPHL